MRERAAISYFFSASSHSCFCEGGRKTASPMELFWKQVFGKKKTAETIFSPPWQTSD